MQGKKKLAIVGGKNIVPDFPEASLAVAAAFAAIIAATLGIKRKGLLP